MMPNEVLHSGCFFGHCAACKAAAKTHPQSGSRLLVNTHPRHGKRRLMLWGILANLRAGKSVIYAIAAGSEPSSHLAAAAEEERLRRELAAEGATAEELRRFAVWDPTEDD